jgi:alpha-tubulin suppressor-like RCC1 family protein
MSIDSGKVFSFGANDHNKLGHDSTEAYISKPKLIDCLSTVRICRISVGDCHCAATSGMKGIVFYLQFKMLDNCSLGV